MVLLSWQLAFRMTWTKACATKIIGPSKHCILTSHVVQMFRRCFFLCCCHWQECLPVHDSKIPTLQASLGREGQLFVILIKLGNLTWNNVSLIWYGYIANIMFFCLLVFTERIIGLWTETLESFNVFFWDRRRKTISRQQSFTGRCPSCTTACLIQKTTRHLQGETLHGF